MRVKKIIKLNKKQFFTRKILILAKKNDKIMEVMEATFEKLISYISKKPRTVTKIVALVFFLYFLGYKIGKTMTLLDR